MGKYALTVDLEAAKARVTALEEALASVDPEAIEEIQDDVTALEAADTALDARLDTAESEIDTLQSDLDAAEAAAATLAGRVTTTESDITALEAADAALDGRLDTAEADVAALEGADTALDGRLDTAESNISTLQAAKKKAFMYYGGGSITAGNNRFANVPGVLVTNPIGTTGYFQPWPVTGTLVALVYYFAAGSMSSGGIYVRPRQAGAELTDQAVTIAHNDASTARVVLGTPLAVTAGDGGGVAMQINHTGAGTTGQFSFAWEIEYD